jgi:uncharacterized protein
LGVAVLGWARPDHVRVGVGVLLILFSTYSLARPSIKPVTAGGALADAGVGFANGILGSLTGLAGILTTIWCACAVGRGISSEPCFSRSARSLR